MKYLFMLGLIFSQFAHAEIVSCISEDKKFQVIADVNFKAKKISAMEYLKNGQRYLSYRNLPMIANKNQYTVVFDQSAIYMELDVSGDKMFGGYFLPRNSILAFERRIVCTRE